MSVLDLIVKKELVGYVDDSQVKNYESINSSGNSLFVDVGGTEQGYTVTLDYTNGSGLNVDFTVEVSTDGTIFVPMGDTDTTITDASGTIIWDIVYSNVSFVRISWTVVSGSVDIYGAFSGKRRH
jgi:hypothetical protein